jgi:hypothetical protein
MRHNLKRRVSRVEEQLAEESDDELLLVLEHARQLHLKLGLLLEQAALLHLIDIRKRQQKRGKP